MYLSRLRAAPLLASQPANKPTNQPAPATHELSPPTPPGDRFLAAFCVDARAFRSFRVDLHVVGTARSDACVRVHGQRARERRVCTGRVGRDREAEGVGGVAVVVAA